MVRTDRIIAILAAAGYRATVSTLHDCRCVRWAGDIGRDTPNRQKIRGERHEAMAAVLRKAHVSAIAYPGGVEVPL